MANYVKKLNARCRGEPVEEDDQSAPITTEAIKEGNTESPPNIKIATSPKNNTKAPSIRPALSRIQEDEVSEATPDTDTISTEYSNPR